MATDWNSMDDAQLVHHELQLERDMVMARFQLATNQLEDSSQLAKLRKEIARSRTAQRAREVTSGVRKDTLRNLHSGSFTPKADATEESAASGGFLQGIVDKVGGND